MEGTINDMDLESVLVSHSHLLENPVTSPRGYSGVAIAERWVIGHGSMLLPILTWSSQLLNSISTLSPGKLTIFDRRLCEDHTFQIYRSPDRGSTEITGRLVAVWKCPLLNETFENSFENWNFDSTNSKTFDRLLLPVFVAIECITAISNGSNAPESTKNIRIQEEGKCVEEKNDIETQIRLVLRRIVYESSICPPTKGSRIEMVSTPFGNPVFIGSVTRGLIGNILGTKACLILMDVNAYPGCEGAPVYVIDRDRKVICGMVIACLSWCRGEWVDYTFAVNFSESLKQILRSRDWLRSEALLHSLPSSDSVHENWNKINAIEILEKSVVVVRCGPNWGTGIFIDEQTGTFLTCAHVVAEAETKDIEITAPTTVHSGNTAWFAQAKLIYKTPESKPYDVALLKIDPKSRKPSLRAIKLAEEPARKGEEVISIGFPFSSRSDATISSGIVSRVSKCMLQTSCCAQSGSSGGAIVRQIDHKMIGMLVCNAVSSNGEILYPRLTMAVPVTVLNTPLTNYLRTADSRTLESLTEHNANVQRIWHFRPFLFSNM